MSKFSNSKISEPYVRIGKTVWSSNFMLKSKGKTAFLIFDKSETFLFCLLNYVFAGIKK
jgi:hypothetical protein